MEITIKKRGENIIQNSRIAKNKLQSFSRNFDNFNAITNEENVEVFEEKIQNLKIEIILQDLPSDSELYENNILICNVILNLLNRFLTKIRYRGDLEALKKYFPKSFSESIQSKQFTDVPDLSVIIGKSIEGVENPLYVSSNGWSIFLSRKEPCPWEEFEKNSLSAVYVSALAVGEIFKLLIPDLFSVEIREEFIYDFITHGKGDQPIKKPSLPSFLDLDITIIGCGGVGQAIAFALNQFDLRGRISLIDPDFIDESNKQRYPLAFDENIGLKKVPYLSGFLMDHSNNLLTISEYISLYEEAISINESLFKMKEVFISVDNKRTRVNLQAAMPRIIWNVWTDTQANTLRYGIGRHDFTDDYQCLACVYYPQGKAPTQMELNATLLGMSEEEINSRIQQNDPIKEEDLQYIFETYSPRLDQVQRLRTLIGKPFNNILHGDCGVFNLRLGERHERTTATHIPVLAGTYAVIQYILHQLEIGKEKIIESIADFNAFTYPSEECLIKKERHSNCICNDPIYQEVFKNKWK